MRSDLGSPGMIRLTELACGFSMRSEGKRVNEDGPELPVRLG